MKRFICTFTILLFAAAGLQAQDWAKAKLAKSPRHPEWMKLKHDSREVQSFVVYPEVKDKATTKVEVPDDAKKKLQ
jgi:carboxymethylenebutenolidase